MALTSMMMMAQPGPPEKDPVYMAEKMTDRMTESLELSDEQAQEVYQINLEFTQQMKAGEASRKALHQGHKEKLSEVLTEAQMKKLEAHAAKRRKAHKHKAHERDAEREEMRVE